MKLGDNIIMITFDSLRYDVALAARTLRLNEFLLNNRLPYRSEKMPKYSEFPQWCRAYAHGTYTLPSHISMLVPGIMPCSNDPAELPPYTRHTRVPFRVYFAGPHQKQADIAIPENMESLPQHLAMQGYETHCVGGVGWFNPERRTTISLTCLFQYYHYRQEFSELNEGSFLEQIRYVESLQLCDKRKPIFLLWNIAATHYPFAGFGTDIIAQRESFELVDRHWLKLMATLPEKWCGILCADHGECFGEDGLHGHAFYHPKVMEVPLAYVEVR
jgi:hypothetical protein